MAKDKQSLDDFAKSIKETGRKKESAIRDFLDENATFHEGDRIVLAIPVTKQVVRMTVTKVTAEQNNAGKLDIAYTFNDDSLLFETSLQKDGYDWQYEQTMEAEALVQEVTEGKERPE